MGLLRPYSPYGSNTKPFPLALAGGLQPRLDRPEDSPSRSSLSFSYSTRGTSMWMSMRSSNGPEMRFWYLVIVPGEQVQGFSESP